jgi:hypothetical protein
MSGRSRLLKLYAALSAPRQQALLEYAEFLAAKEPARVQAVAGEPLPIPRPDEESVVKAIQRLTRTYPMLDGKGVLHEASAQMSRHLLQGVPAREVIDALEAIFRRHFDAWAAENVAPVRSGEP